MITMKRLETQIKNVNEYLANDCINNISIEFYDSGYPGIIILKDGKSKLKGAGISDMDIHHFGSTKTEVHTALTRVIKFLHAREHVENGLHFIGDREITEIFAAAFWR